MKHLLLVLFLLITAAVGAQEIGTIRGNITDAAIGSEPLMMASVSLKDTAWNTRTNFNGNFVFTDVPAGEYTLQVRFLGYTSLEKKIIITDKALVEITTSLEAKSFATDTALSQMGNATTSTFLR